MQDVKIEQVTKYFGEAKGIDRANLHIAKGEFFTLLGPSGCGKTTLLRTLAGFYQQEEGHIYFGDKNVDRVPVHKRNIGMVFQNYAIFPHLTVFENVAYGLKARSIGKADIEKRVMEALEVVELAHLRDRQPSQMSGGQQQRIALARAIVIQPDLLLMDEPLSNLDAKLRLKMRAEIRDLQKRLNITTIYVTHDQEEALAVSDRIAVLEQGVIQQVGKPDEIYLSPVNRFVANFIGTTNFIDAEIGRYDAASRTATMRICDVTVTVPLLRAYEGKAIYSIRPEQLSLSDTAGGSGAEPRIAGTVETVTFLGEKVEISVRLPGGQTVLISERSSAGRNRQLAGGKHVSVRIHPEQSVIFDQHGKEVLKGYEQSGIADA
ncbi:ABC transporter ATP-binding protein [Paenibacillus thalictri]|uniref:Spermidine/putrescine import ATP-binding protein PotA n=1 Tax=Paenibacillus thalictri TaxID=2527873 RepID=A0A4Q9DJ04_9BACL|nr:ABC transporter ATP-binding protein [Paenibacillus thalictri]TBL71383.1 ABC transporter ATP-binding protein [Paenibacillus thalictri]